jgi:hypothetical protein
MPVFQITTLRSENYRVMDFIGESFDHIGAREISDDHWLIAETAVTANAIFKKLKEELPRDVLNMRELHKTDLADKGRLSEEEFNFFRSQASD